MNRSRRSAARKEKRFKALLLTLIALVLVGFLAVILLENVFVLKNVVIEGSTSLTDNEIIRLGKFEFGGSIFSVNADRVRENLESSGQIAVDDIAVQKPSTVKLVVHERSRDALVLNGGRVLVLDSDGYVIDNPTTAPDSGIYVTGLEGTSYKIGRQITAPANKLNAMKTVLEAIKAMNATDYVTEVDLGDLMQITLITRTGITVQLGDTDNMNEKIRWMRSAVSDLESRGERGGTLDVSSGTRADYLSD